MALAPYLAMTNSYLNGLLSQTLDDHYRGGTTMREWSESSSRSAAASDGADWWRHIDDSEEIPAGVQTAPSRTFVYDKSLKRFDYPPSSAD
jgi:hypothetical protein